MDNSTPRQKEDRRSTNLSPLPQRTDRRYKNIPVEALGISERREQERRQSFSEWLLIKRKASGLSQAKAAKTGGLSPNTWSLLEKAHASPSVDTVPKIILALGTDPQETYLRAGYVPPKEALGEDGSREKPSYIEREILNLLRANLAMYSGMEHPQTEYEAAQTSLPAPGGNLLDILRRIEARLERIEVALGLTPGAQ